MTLFPAVRVLPAFCVAAFSDLLSALLLLTLAVTLTAPLLWGADWPLQAVSAALVP
jgi:hypothetical protein